MNSKIKEYREDSIEQMVEDIKDLESIGVDGDDLWESIRLCNYSFYSTEEDKIKAFKKAGYTVELG